MSKYNNSSYWMNDWDDDETKIVHFDDETNEKNANVLDFGGTETQNEATVYSRVELCDSDDWVWVHG